jgi:hypothetical protein
MKKSPYLLTALCGLAAVSAVQAQTAVAVNAPPKVIQIYREVIKPGHGTAHAKTEAGWPAAFAKANWPSHYIAMTSTSGPTEAWFISGWDSYAAYEKDGKEIEKNAALQSELDRLGAADGEHVNNVISMFATYRDDLSYRSGVNVSEMRYFMLTTFRVKPGRGDGFAAARKLVQAAHEKANMNEHWATYQVTSGAPAGTFLLMLPMKSMAELDTAQEIHGKPYEDAMGPENQKKVADLMNESVDSSTAVLFAFSPKMSYPPKEWMAADTYWAPNVERAAVAGDKAKVPAKKQN